MSRAEFSFSKLLHNGRLQYALPLDLRFLRTSNAQVHKKLHPEIGDSKLINSNDNNNLIFSEYSKALEDMIAGDESILAEGKKLKDEADEKLKPRDHDTSDNHSYTLFMADEAKSMLEYVERKVYEGKGAYENRDKQHDYHQERVTTLLNNISINPILYFRVRI